MIKIIGFEYMCRLLNLKYVEVAKMLDISRQTVNSWISGHRNIPKKHIETLSSKLNDMPTEYFQKELTSEEMDEVEIIIIDKIVKEVRTADEAREENIRLVNFGSDVGRPQIAFNSKVLLDIEDVFIIKEKLDEVLIMAYDEENEIIFNIIKNLIYIILDKKVKYSILDDALNAIYNNNAFEENSEEKITNWKNMDFEKELIKLIKRRYKQSEWEYKMDTGEIKR